MENNQIKNFLDNMFNSISQENIDLYKKIIGENEFNVAELSDFNSFYFKLIYPFEKFLSGFVRTEISNNDELVFIYKNSQFIKHHFEYWIEKIEGSTCSADKSRTIMRALINHYKTGEEIVFNYNQKYTFHLPKIVFKDQLLITEFYKSVKNLYYGNPTQYINCLKVLSEIWNEKKRIEDILKEDIKNSEDK
jgi:hypothetical protein